MENSGRCQVDFALRKTHHPLAANIDVVLAPSGRGGTVGVESPDRIIACPIIVLTEPFPVASWRISPEADGNPAVK
jgi:hypothetical protein